MEIDITDLVEKARSTFVTWAVDAAFTYVIAQPGFQWVAFPIVAGIFKGILTFILDYLSNQGVMQAFFLNTAIRKAGQAQDFVDAANALENLPKDASDETYKAAENARALAFHNFVMVTM